MTRAEVRPRLTVAICGEIATVRGHGRDVVLRKLSVASRRGPRGSRIVRAEHVPAVLAAVRYLRGHADVVVAGVPTEDCA